MSFENNIRLKVAFLVFIASNLCFEAVGDQYTIDIKEVPHTFQKLESLTTRYAALEDESAQIKTRKATSEANLGKTNATITRLHSVARNTQLKITTLESENTSRTARLKEVKNNLLPLEVDNLKNLNGAREELLPKLASAAKSLKETLSQLASTREEAKSNKDLLAKLKEGTGGPKQTYTATVLSITHRTKPFSSTAASKKEAIRNALEECLKQYSDCEVQSVNESLESVAQRESLIEETTKKLRLQQEVYLPRLEEQSQEEADALALLKTQSSSATQDATEAKDRVTVLYEEIKSTEAAIKAAKAQIEQLKKQQIVTTEQITAAEDEKRLLLESLKAISSELSTNEADLKSTWDSKKQVEQRIESYRYDVVRTARLDGTRIGIRSAISYAVSKGRSLIFPQGVQQGKSARAEYCGLLSRRDGYRAGYFSPKQESHHYQNGLRDGKCQVEAWHRDRTFIETANRALSTLQWQHSELTRSMDGLLISETQGIERLEEKTKTLFPDFQMAFDTKMPSALPEYPEFLSENVPATPDHRQFRPATLIPVSPRDFNFVGDGDLKHFGHPSLDDLFVQELKKAIVAEAADRLPTVVEEVTATHFAKGFTAGWEEEKASRPCTADPQLIELGEYDRGLINSLKEHSEPLRRIAQREALYRVTVDYLANREGKAAGSKIAKEAAHSKAKEMVYPEGFQTGKSARTEYCRLIGAREGYRKGYFDKERHSKAYVSGFEEGKCLAESLHRNDLAKASPSGVTEIALPTANERPSAPQDRTKRSESIPLQSHYYGYKALAQIGSQLLLNPQALQQGGAKPKHRKDNGREQSAPNPPLPLRETYVRYSEYLTGHEPVPPTAMNYGLKSLPTVPSIASLASEIQLASQSSDFGNESVNHLYRKGFESAALRELNELLPKAIQEESRLQFAKGYSEGWEDPVAKQGCSPNPLFVELGTYDRALGDGVHESWENARTIAQESLNRTYEV